MAREGSQRSAEAGQAAVESALTLPLVIFMILGMLQFFLMLQGRMLAQYAAYKAVRAGSVNQASCLAMTHAAVVTLLPAITETTGASLLVSAFAARRGNQYAAALDGGFTGPIVEIKRLSPVTADEEGNDQPDTAHQPITFQMVFWYRMKIPFANWVISKMLLAHFGLQPYTYANPLMLAQKNANWNLGSARLDPNLWHGRLLGTAMQQWANQKQYVFPIMVNASMRMMTPPKARFLPPQVPLECPLVPNLQELN